MSYNKENIYEITGYFEFTSAFSVLVKAKNKKEASEKFNENFDNYVDIDMHKDISELTKIKTDNPEIVENQ